MEDKLVLQETFNIINKDFFIQKEGENTEQQIKAGFDFIRERLTDRIRYLMDNEYEKLMRLLYRIDVNELKLKKAFKENTFDDMPPIIADLVIERQIIKARLRTTYQSEFNNMADDIE
jgi:hypothetical protein